jgi:hypothetical protein
MARPAAHILCVTHHHELELTVAPCRNDPLESKKANISFVDSAVDAVEPDGATNCGT